VTKDPNSNSSNSTTAKTDSPLLVKPILMQRMAAIRIMLRYGTLAFKPIKLRKIRTPKAPTAPDDCYVMLYRESATMLDDVRCCQISTCHAVEPV